MNKLFCSALLTFVAISSYSQVTFSPAVRAGVNFSNLTELESSYKTGFYAGVAGGINLTKRYTLQPEITFSQQGASDVPLEYYDYNTGEQISQRTDIVQSYLSLAVMNKFNIVDGFNIAVGPFLDFIMDDNVTSRESDADLGIQFGFGYQTASGFAFEARLKKGVADVVNNEYYQGGDGFFFGDYNTNLVFQVGAAYYFDFKKTEPNAE
ncbi:MAG TPA: porin family protein [Flavobacterium sp.]|jgi:hypothetical protein|nr:porin family protein [Flavobacterium sp.]